MNSIDKLQKLGIEFTSDFGDKFRDFLNLITTGENERYGKYIGYELDLSCDTIKVIQEKGSELIKINDYENFPNEGSFEVIKSKMIHYEDGGEIESNNIPDWVGIFTYPNALIYTDKRIEKSGDYHVIGLIYFTPFNIVIKDKSEKYSEVHELMKKEYSKLKKEKRVQISSSGQYDYIGESDDTRDKLHDVDRYRRSISDFETGTPVVHHSIDSSGNKKEESGEVVIRDNKKAISLYKDENYSGIHERIINPNWNNVEKFSEANSRGDKPFKISTDEYVYSSFIPYPKKRDKKDDFEDYLNDLYSKKFTSEKEALKEFSYLENKIKNSDSVPGISYHYFTSSLGSLLRKLDPVSFSSAYNEWAGSYTKEKGGTMSDKFESISPKTYFINLKYAGKVEDDIMSEIIDDYKKGLLPDNVLWEILNDDFILSSRIASKTYKQLGFKPFSGFPLTKLVDGGEIDENENTSQLYDIVDSDGDIIKRNQTEENVIDYINTVVFYELEDINEEPVTTIEDAERVLKASTDMKITPSSKEAVKFEEGGEMIDNEDVDTELEIPSSLYVYRFHEERGEIHAYVENMKTGNNIWEFNYPDYSLDAEERDFQSTPVEDGFMRHWDDIIGLEKYLKKLNILQGSETIITEQEAIKKYDYYRVGGRLTNDYGFVKSKPFYEEDERVVIKDKNGTWTIPTVIKTKFKDPHDNTTLYIVEEGGAAYLASELKPYSD